MINIAAEIFREYDIRGQYPLKLNEPLAHLIGKALGSEILIAKQQCCYVGWDGRNSSPSLRDALVSGICSTGCHVKIIGMVPTAAVFWSIKEQALSCAMITGSHNPKQDNGIKIAVAGTPRSGDDIQVLLSRIQLNLFHEGQGEVEDASHLIHQYQQKLIQNQQLLRPLTVVVDAGNGVGGPIMCQALKAIGATVIEIACDINGDFPLHHPDPAKTKNLRWLQAAVSEHNADLGIALDGDADRIGVVDNNGNVILPDRLSLLFVKDILANPLNQAQSRTILFDVKCTQQLHDYTKKWGGVPLMIATGHTSMKKTIKKTNALFATELSGHILFNDHNSIGVDDGIYAGIRLCHLLSASQFSLSQRLAEFKQTVASDEIQIQVNESEKFSIMSLIQRTIFLDHPKATIDGLRILFDDGWALIRASNTTACLTLRFEASNQQSFALIQNEVYQQLIQVLPNLKLSQLNG